jgi:hypothetical protein
MYSLYITYIWQSNYSNMIKTSGFWPRVRARALCAPVFLGLYTQRGRCAPPPRLFSFTDPSGDNNDNLSAIANVSGSIYMVIVHTFNTWWGPNFVYEFSCFWLFKEHFGRVALRAPETTSLHGLWRGEGGGGGGGGRGEQTSSGRQ